MINALNKPSDEKNYADAAAQFAYRAYGFSGDQYNYIVSSIDKQFMEDGDDVSGIYCTAR